MVKKIFNFINREVSGLHEAAYLLGFFAFLSQLLALVRDRLFAHQFGAGATLDIYYAAFRIPDLIFISVASLVSVSVLVPFVIEKLSISKDETRRLIDGLFSFFFILIVVVSLFAFFLMPVLAPIIFSGFDGTMMEALISLSRIILVSPILLGISNFFGSITQASKRFFVYAISPLLYNFGIIAGILWFYPNFGITGLGLGVILGALLHLLIQVPAVVADGLFPRLSFSFDWDVIVRVSSISIPRTITLGLSQLTIIWFVALASRMGEGAISIFNFSWNLQSVPLSIVGVSYSLAAFPTLSKLFSEGKRDLFIGHIISAARHVVFWSLPIAVLFIVLRAQIVRTILGSGAFDWADTRLTAAALALFAVSAVAQGLILLFVRGYYAEGKTGRPLVLSLISSIVAVVLAWGLVRLITLVPVFGYFIESLLRVADLSGTLVLVLPLAYSVSMILNVWLLWYFYEGDVKSFAGPLGNTLFSSFSSSVIMGAVAYGGLNIFSQIFDLDTVLGVFLQGLVSGLIGIVAGVLVLYLLKSNELSTVWRTLHHKIWGVKAIAPELREL